MSFATWNFLKVYARIRESFLTAHPKKRLFPEPVEDSEAYNRSFITIGEKGKKIGVVVVALVILLLSQSRNSK